MPAVPLRFLTLILLGLLPVAVYWNTIFHSYGFRDDYSILREAREEPGKVFAFCSSHARPIYGLLLERSFATLKTVDDLRWIRLLTAVLLGAVAIATFASLRLVGWEPIPSALVAALIPLLPGAQVMVSWAVTWPFALALLLTMGGFVCAERAFRRDAAVPRPLPWTAAVLLFAASALIYQSSPLFQVVLVAAGFLQRRDQPFLCIGVWASRHLATLAVGLALAFTIAFTAFALEWLPVSERIGIASDWEKKISSFLLGPLPNAFALIVLNRTDGAPMAPLLAAAVVTLVLGAGAVAEWHRRGVRRAVAWVAALGLFVVAACCVLLVVAENSAAYRTLLPVTGVVAVFLAATLRDLLGAVASRLTLAVLVTVATLLAHRQAYRLMAWPQGLEWMLVQEGAADIHPEEEPAVFIRWPRETDAPARMIFWDEFGSFSSLSPWASIEMLGAAVRERHPGDPGVMRRVHVDTGELPDPEMDYAVTIDLRRLREFQGL